MSLRGMKQSVLILNTQILILPNELHQTPNRLLRKSSN